MPELRKDPILGRWVIIASERTQRLYERKKKGITPSEKNCPFCKGRERAETEEIFSLKDQEGNWKVKVVPSKTPFLKTSSDLWNKGKGPYDLINAVGSHEIVIESPDHIGNMADLSQERIGDVFLTYCSRMSELQKNEQIKYVLAFKNYGVEAGGGKINHSRSQLIATPVNLKRVKEELEGAKFYYDYRERCIFCDIIQQELEQKERIVLDEDGFVALVPFAPRFPFEVWVLPKEHSPDFCMAGQGDAGSLASVIKKVLLKIKVLLDDPAYNYVVHTAPFRRKHAGYWSTIEEDYHWHIEITPRLTQVAGFEWGTGFYICPVGPEEGAKALRETKVELVCQN